MYWDFKIIQTCPKTYQRCTKKIKDLLRFTKITRSANIFKIYKDSNILICLAKYWNPISFWPQPFPKLKFHFLGPALSNMFNIDRQDYSAPARPKNKSKIMVPNTLSSLEIIFPKNDLGFLLVLVAVLLHKIRGYKVPNLIEIPKKQKQQWISRR